MECFAINFLEGNFINIWADSLESSYSLTCGCDVIRFIKDGVQIASVFRDQISKIQRFDCSSSGCHYVAVEF